MPDLVFTPGAHFEREIILAPMTLNKVTFDLICQVAQAQHEIAETMLRIEPQQMPQHRPSPNLDQHFGHRDAVRAQSRASSATEDYRLHAGLVTVRSNN